MNASLPRRMERFLVKLRKWRRYHRDGSEGFVEEREVGAFVAVDLIPVAYGIRRGILRECRNLEEAFLEVDCAAERRGHTCTPTCTRWRPGIAGTSS